MKNCDYQFRVEDKTVKIFPPGMEKFIEIFFLAAKLLFFLQCLFIEFLCALLFKDAFILVF